MTGDTTVQSDQIARGCLVEGGTISWGRGPSADYLALHDALAAGRESPSKLTLLRGSDGGVEADRWLHASAAGPSIWRRSSSTIFR